MTKTTAEVLDEIEETLRAKTTPATIGPMTLEVIPSGVVFQVLRDARKPEPSKFVDHWTKRYSPVGTPGDEEYRCTTCDVLVGGGQPMTRARHEEVYHSKEGLLRA